MTELNIIALTFPNGETVLGSIVKETEQQITLEHPAYIHTQENNGKTGVALSPYLPFSKDDVFEFPIFGIQSRTTIDDRLCEEYQKIFFPGKIQLVNKPGIIV